MNIAAKADMMRHIEDAEAQIRRIERKLAELKRERAVDWSHAGDAGRIADELRDVLQGVGA